MLDEITIFTVFSTTISFENEEDDEDEDVKGFGDDEDDEKGVLCFKLVDLSFFLLGRRVSVDSKSLFKDIFSEAAELEIFFEITVEDIF